MFVFEIYSVGVIVILRDAAIETAYISAEEFDKIVIPMNMVGNPHKGLGIP